MTFQDPLNRWRGAELKDPLLAKRALLGREVRKVLAAHPEGLTRTELSALMPEAGEVLSWLRTRKFVRMSPSNAKVNGTRGELWFVSEPKQL